MAATPIWIEKEHRWKIRARRNGKEKVFSSSKPGKTGKSEVLRKYRLFLEGENPDRYSITVGKAFEEYKEYLSLKNGTASTPYRQAEILGRLYILPSLEKKKLRIVTLRDWQNCINTATRQDGSGEPLTKKYLSNIRGVITGFMKWAYQNDLTDPLRGDLYIPVGHPTKGKDILQPSEIRAVFSNPSDDFYYPAWCFMLCTGIRPGECYGLKVSDIKKDTIVIRRSINDRHIITEGKNANAQRTIPLFDTIEKIINDTIARNERYGLHTEWIFCSPTGAPADQQISRNHWKKYAASLGIKNTSPYCFRHTFVSMVKNSVPEQMVKAIVGHSVRMDTFGVYGHAMEGEVQKAAEILDLTIAKTISS